MCCQCQKCFTVANGVKNNQQKTEQDCTVTSDLQTVHNKSESEFEFLICLLQHAVNPLDVLYGFSTNDGSHIIAQMFFF